MKYGIVIVFSLGIFFSCHKKVAIQGAPSPTPPHMMPTIGSYVEVNLNIPVNNNVFSIDLYNELKTQKENLFFSPYSISSALAMTYLGSRSKTEYQMSEVLWFSLKQNDFHLAFKKHKDNLLEKSTKDAELNFSNSIWIQKKYSLLDDYYRQLKTYYGSSFNYVDFKNQSEKARQTINKWVLKETNEKIENLIPQGAVNKSTRLVLANAIYFLGKWGTPFNKGDTGKDIFYLNDEVDEYVKFMNLYRKNFLYMENEMLEIIEMPYADNNFSMMIILPKEHDGILKVETYLTPTNIQHWTTAMDHQKIDVTIPRLKLETSFELSKALKSMGMTDAFSDEADFSGMTGKYDLKIDKVIHKAFIEINEKGSEAAASTAIIMMEKTVFNPEKRIHFKANHPFLFIIKDIETQTILFMGRVMNPTT